MILLLHRRDKNLEQDVSLDSENLIAGRLCLLFYDFKDVPPLLVQDELRQQYFGPVQAVSFFPVYSSGPHIDSKFS